MNILSTKSAFIFIILIAFSFPLSAQEKEKGKLADFEEEVEKKTSSDDSNTSQSNSYEDEEYDGDCNNIASDIENCIFMARAAVAILGGTKVIMFFSEEESEDGYWNIGYSDYPYSSNSDGLFDKSSLKKYSVYSKLSYFRESNSLNAISFNTRLSPIPSIALEINYSDFTEKLNSRYDHLRMYDVFLNYNRLKYDNLAFWWGIGLKGIIGDGSNQAFALNFGTNIFIPEKPVSIGINFNIGFYDANNVYDFSPKIRYHLHRAEISLGYRTFNAGNVSINGWSLGVGFYL